MPYEFVGRRTLQRGKTLWELLGNLKNNGVGRIVARNQFEKYSPCYYRIIKVETLAPEGRVQCLPPVLELDEVRRVRALVHTVHRGKYMGQEWLSYVTYKPDFKLIPIDEEEAFTKLKKGELPEEPPQKASIAPTQTSFPPLLRELLVRDMKANGKAVVEPILPLKYLPGTRIAKDGEIPTFEAKPDLDISVDCELYADVYKSKQGSV